MALAKILPRFETEPSRVASLAAVFTTKTGEQGRAQAVAAAELRGFEKGVAAGRAEFDAKLDEERSAFVEGLQSERARWIEEEAGLISVGWDNMLLELQTRLSDTVAALLLPVIGAALAAKAVTELSVAIVDLLSQDKQPFIKVGGPEDLLTALRARLGVRAANIEFCAGAGADLKLVMGDTVIETQLEAWQARLSQAIDEARNG